MAMTLLLLVMAAMPVLAATLAGLLFWYYRSWSTWKAGQGGAFARKEA